MKRSVDIEHEDIDILVDGELVLHIGQVSDEDTINLFLYPEGDLVESLMHQERPDSRCTHEIIMERRKI
uniref:Uncharacterized protein n=1 Tax=viral metagenome TaxID=1070528 RepID=A0A6M3J9T4_9ZZZZ